MLQSSRCVSDAIDCCQIAETKRGKKQYADNYTNPLNLNLVKQVCAAAQRWNTLFRISAVNNYFPLSRSFVRNHVLHDILVARCYFIYLLTEENFRRTKLPAW